MAAGAQPVAREWTIVEGAADAAARSRRAPPNAA